mmetsp:Transcript_19442/g.49419  ORF Transcript_19442/g.49419 Transcript_19442/m.49419 type:complete len:212 (+) Transcript_19442:2798-3433(+)
MRATRARTGRRWFAAWPSGWLCAPSGHLWVTRSPSARGNSSMASPAVPPCPSPWSAGSSHLSSFWTRGTVGPFSRSRSCVCSPSPSPSAPAASCGSPGLRHPRLRSRSPAGCCLGSARRCTGCGARTAACARTAPSTSRARSFTSRLPQQLAWSRGRASPHSDRRRAASSSAWASPAGGASARTRSRPQYFTPSASRACTEAPRSAGAAIP